MQLPAALVWRKSYRPVPVADASLGYLHSPPPLPLLLSVQKLILVRSTRPRAVLSFALTYPILFHSILFPDLHSQELHPPNLPLSCHIS
jgi:hypothetical protein